MKKKIIIGSLLAVCMLMILPSVSAVEFNTVVEENERGSFGSFLEHLWDLFMDSPLGLLLHYISSFIHDLIYGPPEKI